jgi:anti-anti-sigma regulatory factor
VGQCFPICVAQGVAMSASDRTVLLFPCMAGSTYRRTLRRALLNALRISESPVIVDLSACGTLNQEDIHLLLDCIAQRAGRDTQILFVAISPVIQALLDVTRISSLVPVLDSLEAALCYPQIAAKNCFETQAMNPSEPSSLESSSFLTGVRE